MVTKFKTSDIKKIFGLSSQSLHQIRQIGIVSPSVEKKGQGGINWYSFNDLIELAVALKLIKHGVKMTDVRDLFNREGYTDWKDHTHIFIFGNKYKKEKIGNKILKKIKVEEDSFIISIEKIRENLNIKIKNLL